MNKKLNISTLEAEYLDILKKIFTDPPSLGLVTWKEICDLFQELKTKLGATLTVGNGAPTIVVLNGEVGYFDYPHPSKPSERRILSARKFLKNSGVEPP